MKKLLMILLLPTIALAMSLSGDDWRDPLRTKQWFPPLASDTLVGRASTDTFSATKTFSVPWASTVTTGTAPFSVLSTTLVPNLYVARSALADTSTTIPNLTGDVTSVGTVTTLTNAPVIAKTLTGYSAAAGTVTSSDSILSAIQKVDGNSTLPKTINTKAEKDAGDTVTSKIVAPNYQLTPTATGVQRIETGNDNILINPSFENATYNTGWGATLGSTVVETGLFQDGAQSLKITSSGAGIRFYQSSTQNAANFKGLKGLARCYIDTTDTVTQLCALVDGTTSGFDTGCTTVAATTGTNPWQIAEVPFTMGGTSNGVVVKSATTTTQPTYIDSCYVGPNTKLTNLTGEVTSVGAVTTVTNSAVISKVLTGFSAATGLITATDTILQGIQKNAGNDALKQPLATLTTKGDLYVATGASTVVRQAIGSDTQVLTADSAQTNGLKWSAPQISTKAQNEGASTLATEIQVPNNQYTTTATGKRLLETDNDNMLVNYSMEGISAAGVADGWTNASTNSVATITTNSAEITHGNQAQKIVLTAGVLNYSAYIATGSGIQKQGYVLGTYAAPSSWTDFQVCSTIDSAEQTCVPTTSLILDGAYHQIKIPIVFGSINAGIKYKTTSAVTGTFLADRSKVAQGLDLKSVTVDTDMINAGALTVTATTSNPTKGTVVVDRFLVSRRGQWLEALYQYQQSSTGSAGSGQYIWNLPTGYAFDTNYITPFSGSSIYTTPTALALAYVGTGTFSNAASGVSSTCRLYAYSSTAFRASCIGNSADGAATQWTISSSQYGFIEAASMAYTFNVRAPIAGWASNSVTYSAASSNFSGRNDGTITVTATTTNPTKGTATTDRIISSRYLNRLIADYQYEQSSGGTNGSGDILYALPAGLSFDSSVVNFVTASSALSVANPKAIIGFGQMSNNGSNYTSGVLLAYDSTHFRFMHGTGGSPTIQSTSASSSFGAAIGIGFHIDAAISGWSDNGVIFGRFDTPSVSYYASANFSSSTSTPVNFDSKIYDSCTPACVTTGSGWKFTAPQSRKYRVHAWIDGAPAAASADILLIYKNGTSFQAMSYSNVVGNSGVDGTVTIDLIKGDYIDIRNSFSSTYGGGAITSRNSHIEIEAVANGN